MKKIFTALFGALLLSATVSTADAATVYYMNSDNLEDENSNSWAVVWAYSWTPEVWEQLTPTTIDGHKLYPFTTDNTGGVIFVDQKGWDGDKKQTDDLNIIDGAVYYYDSTKNEQPIAYVKDGKYEANPDYVVYEPTGTDIYLRGTMNNWNPQARYEFEQVGEKIYQLKISNIDAGAQFKISHADWNDGNWGADTEANIKPDGTYILKAKGGDLKAYQRLYNVVLTFEEQLNKLTVSANEGEAP